MEIIRDIEQGSPEWFSIRLGSIGGSSISKAVAGGKGDTRRKLMYDLAGEILTGVQADSYSFRHADRGKEFEPEARDLYAFERGVEVEQVALVKAGPHKHYSPDGLCDGLIEIKVRIPSVFIEAVEEGKIPTSDRKQIQWGLHLCEREWCDYIQHCPEMVDRPQFVQRIYRDEKEIKALNSGADEFIAELLDLVKRFKAGA